MLAAERAMTEFPRTSFERATSGRDPEFQHSLTREIVRAITQTSLCTDDTKPPIMAIRTGETIEALVSCLITFASMSPSFDTPSHLREFAESTAKRIKRDVARARAEGVFNQFGAAKGGRA